MEHLTLETFKDKISDIENWEFKGELPCILKYTAAWCSPCRTLTPILENLSKEYSEKINIYEIDVDEESELSSIFNIRSVPTMIFCSMDNKTQTISGSVPKSNIVNIIETII